MNYSEKDLVQARTYLQSNVALRAAVGARPADALEPRYLGAGEHNLNFRFDVPEGASFVLRINVVSQPFHENQVAYEYEALRALEPSRCTPRPVYLDESDATFAKGALVIEFREGAELDFNRLRPGDLQCAAQLMADVHAVKPSPDSKLMRPRDPLRSLFDECLERFGLYRSSAYEDARITRWAESFIAACKALLDTPFQAGDCSHIVNTETLPSHFLIPSRSAAEAARSICLFDAALPDKRRPHSASHASAGNGEHVSLPGQAGDSSHPRDTPGFAEPAEQPICDRPRNASRTTISAGRFCDDPGSFIDWERPIIGEVAQDVAYFTCPTTTFWDSDFLFPADKVEQFVEDYWRAVDGRFERGSFDARFKAYRALTTLRSVTWCCKALLQYGPFLAAGADKDDGVYTTDKTLAKLPIYLSDEFMELIARECFDLPFAR